MKPARQKQPGLFARLTTAALQSEPVREFSRRLYRATGAHFNDAVSYSFALLDSYHGVDTAVIAEIERQNPGGRVRRWWRSVRPKPDAPAEQPVTFSIPELAAATRWAADLGLVTRSPEEAVMAWRAAQATANFQARKGDPSAT